MNKSKKITFQNGREFLGYSFGSDRNIECEVVVCTSMVGYQEILSNPAYIGKIVVMTYPIIGSYGLTDEDYESSSLTAAGLVVREYNDFPSNFRYTKTLAEEMSECEVSGIYGVDTREIAHMIRDEGEMRAFITDATLEGEGKNLCPIQIEAPLIKDVSCNKVWYSRTANFKYNVVALDLGITVSSISSLNSRGCNVIVVPFDTKEDEILSLRPDGIFISDGPGYPSDISTAVSLVKKLAEKLPILGVGMGMLVIAEAFGALVKKMKVGHYGSNHPVKNIRTNRIEIVSQGHGYSVEEQSVYGTDLFVTHRNLIDNSIEGILNNGRTVSAVAFHPDTTLGDTDSAYIYSDFIESIERYVSGKGESDA